MVRPAHGASQSSAMADNEVTNKGRIRSGYDITIRTRRVTRHRHGVDAGEDFAVTVERLVDANRPRMLDSAEEEAREMRAAWEGSEKEAAISFVAVGAANDQAGSRSSTDLFGGARMVQVHVRQEDRRNRAPESPELLCNRVRAGGETRIDERERAIICLDKVDVGSTGAMQPPDSRCEEVGHGRRVPALRVVRQRPGFM